MRSSVAIRLLFTVLTCLLIPSAWADRAVPVWFDAAWHYRVPLTLPAATAVNSTVVVNVDFNALIAQMGISGTFDERSPRVVRPGGALATIQEYNERVYNGVLDAASNGRGEVRFIAQDAAAAGTYYVYFDIVANGAKAANAATTINGTFEQSVGSTPTSWVVSALNARGAQNDEVYRTALGATTTVAAGCQTGTQSVDSSPARSGAVATGEAWMLLGYRDRCEDGNGEEHIRLSRDIAVPAGAAAGNLTFNFQVQGWDGISNATNYDWVIVSVNGTAVNHTALGINNTTTPQLVIDAGRIGRNAYNTTYLDHGWKQATLNLSAYAGSTINFRVETRHTSSDDDYRSWVKLDDVAWSVQTATVGTPQGFGVNIISPNDTAVGSASSLTAGQRVLVRAQLDANVTSATADIYNNAGTLVLGGVILYDNGTHGDATAGDRIWTNDGSVAAQPSYTILSTDAVGANWRVRVFAPDASTSSICRQRPGAPARVAEYAVRAGELLQHRRTAVYGVRNDSERHHRCGYGARPDQCRGFTQGDSRCVARIHGHRHERGSWCGGRQLGGVSESDSYHACDVRDVSLFGRRHTGAVRRFDVAGAHRADLQLRHQRVVLHGRNHVRLHTRAGCERFRCGDSRRANRAVGRDGSTHRRG